MQSRVKRPTVKSLMKSFLNCPELVIEKIDLIESQSDDGWDASKIFVDVRPAKRAANRCPICGGLCTKEGKGVQGKLWRAPDLNGIPVYLRGDTNRVKCPVHNIKIADVPWAFQDCNFTKDFDRTVAYLALNAPKSIVAEYMRIDWYTVGRCMARVYHDLEPDPLARFKDLEYICVDEKSYKKGHKYVTIVTNLVTGRVVWVGKGHGYGVFELFAKLLDEQGLCENIKVVAGDGASWITAVTSKFFKNATRCEDAFHVVQWLTEGLDEVRKGSRKRAAERLQKEMEAAEELRKEMEAAEELRKKAEEAANDVAIKIDNCPETDGSSDSGEAETNGEKESSVANESTPRTIEEIQESIAKIQQHIDGYKGLRFAMLKAGENVTFHQQEIIEMLEISDPVLATCYRLKEVLRLTLKTGDVAVAEPLFDDCVSRIEKCGDPTFAKLAGKLKRHKQYIMNSIELGYSSSLSEATNSQIQNLIGRAHGFREFDSLQAMILMSRSTLVIPLPHRLKEMRARMEITMRRQDRRAQSRKERFERGLESHSARLKKLTKKLGIPDRTAKTASDSEACAG